MGFRAGQELARGHPALSSTCGTRRRHFRQAMGPTPAAPRAPKSEHKQLSRPPSPAGPLTPDSTGAFGHSGGWKAQGRPALPAGLLGWASPRSQAAEPRVREAEQVPVLPYPPPGPTQLPRRASVPGTKGGGQPQPIHAAGPLPSKCSVVTRPSATMKAIF